MSSDANFASLIGDDMNKLITTLIAEHTDKALGYYAGESRQDSFLETTIDIWHELIEHRKLVIGRGSIAAQVPGKATYSFNSLSDGEKAVFYYVGHILLVEPNSYIIDGRARKPLAIWLSVVSFGISLNKFVQIASSFI